LAKAVNQRWKLRIPKRLLNIGGEEQCYNFLVEEKTNEETTKNEKRSKHDD